MLNNENKFSGKVVLITGAASGIGNATAKAFAQAGATVALADINETDLKRASLQIEQEGGKSSYHVTDVANPEHVTECVNSIIKEHGKLDCAFNNAGISGPMGAMLDNYKLQDWDRVFSINIRGVMLFMQAEIKQMLEQGGGTIVNTASIWGLVGAAGCSAYVASKHAVAGLTKAAGIEYANKGIRINAVCPGTIRTPILKEAEKMMADFENQMAALHPIGRIGEPREVAEAVMWLSSPASSFVVGQNLPVDGGFTLQ